MVVLLIMEGGDNQEAMQGIKASLLTTRNSAAPLPSELLGDIAYKALQP